MSNYKTCCFVGHREVLESEIVKESLLNEVENLIINKNVKVFMFGSRGKFNKLCYDAVSQLKEKYPYIKRVYIRAEYPCISDEYMSYLLQSYEDSYYPDRIKGAGKAVYAERNIYMIDNSDFCVIYYNKNYNPPMRKNSKKDLAEYQPKSGTKIAYEYAKQRGVTLINLKP